MSPPCKIVTRSPGCLKRYILSTLFQRSCRLNPKQPLLLKLNSYTNQIRIVKKKKRKSRKKNLCNLFPHLGGNWIILMCLNYRKSKFLHLKLQLISKCSNSCRPSKNLNFITIFRNLKMQLLSICHFMFQKELCSHQLNSRIKSKSSMVSGMYSM